MAKSALKSVEKHGLFDKLYWENWQTIMRKKMIEITYSLFTWKQIPNKQRFIYENGQNKNAAIWIFK